MVIRILKSLLIALLVILSLFIMWIILPRIWSSLNPAKPPMGYFLTPVTYAAIWLGIDKLADLEPAVPDNIEEIKDVEYKNINGKSLQLDIYRPKNLDKAAPLLVFIHGGSWKSGKRSDYLVYLISYAQKGYITATVSYRLLRDGPYPACIEDITDALRWFCGNAETYGYDPSRIAIIGGSAGAHLATLAAYGWNNPAHINDTSVLHPVYQKVRAVVDIYGPVDLTTEYARNHSLVTSFLVKRWDEAPEIFREASPVHYLDKSDPPTLIFHGTSDKLVPVSQSDMLKSKLDSLGVPCVLHRFPGWPHTMDIVLRVNKYCQIKMDEFFSQYLN